MSAPSDVTVTRYGDSFLVAWSPVDDPQVAGYNVYRTFFPYSFFTRWGRLNQAPLNDTSYLDDGVYIWWLTQYYWVAAVDGSGNVLSMSTPVAMDPRIPDTSPPAAPFNVVVKDVDSLSINWDYANTEPDFSGFNIYLYPGGAEPPVKLNSTPLVGDFFYYEGGGLGDAVSVNSVDTSGNESAPIPVAAASAAEYITDFNEPEYPFNSISFSGLWEAEPYPGAYGGQLWVCNAKNDAVEVTVEVASNGSKLTLYSARYWQCGSCQVTVVNEDTQKVELSETVDLFYDNLDSFEPEYGFEVCKASGLSYGTYTIRVENLGIMSITYWPDDFLAWCEEMGIEPPPFPDDMHNINVDYLMLKG
ncbi:MAG: hypothetical protein JW854_14285 [Actinobacteria bacterium]|nr:hypothetical protein [Actinomycetota bacterium]